MAHMRWIHWIAWRSEKIWGTRKSNFWTGRAIQSKKKKKKVHIFLFLTVCTNHKSISSSLFRTITIKRRKSKENMNWRHLSSALPTGQSVPEQFVHGASNPWKNINTGSMQPWFSFHEWVRTHRLELPLRWLPLVFIGCGKNLLRLFLCSFYFL